MCRLLVVRREEKIPIFEELESFSKKCEQSSVYQGHGWGISYLSGKKWLTYKNIKPIWECDLNKFGSTKFFIVHVRSAFKNKDIVIENNMPFFDNNFIFIFNGELRGVKLNFEGRTGAKKIFNMIKKFCEKNFLEGFKKSVDVIKKRTKNIKGMNIVLVNKKNLKIFVSSNFNTDEDYFSLNLKNNKNNLVLCSEKMEESGWTNLGNNFFKVF